MIKRSMGSDGQLDRTLNSVSLIIGFQSGLHKDNTSRSKLSTVIILVQGFRDTDRQNERGKAISNE